MVNKVIAEARELQPTSERWQEIADAQYVAGHWLARKFSNREFIRHRVGEAAYLHPSLDQDIQSAAALRPEIATLEQKLGTKAEELQQRREPFTNGVFYDGTIDQTITVRAHSWSDMDEPAFERADGKIALVDVDKLPVYLDQLAAKYLSRDEISKEWFPQASFLLSFEASDYLQLVGKRPAQFDSYNQRKFTPSHGTAYIARDFVDKITELYQGLKERCQPVREVISQGAETFEEQELWNHFTVQVSPINPPQRLLRSFTEQRFPLQPTVRTWHQAVKLTQRVKEYNATKASVKATVLIGPSPYKS